MLESVSKASYAAKRGSQMASAAGTMSKKAASKAAGKVVEKTAEAAQKIADALAKPEDPRPEELIARLKKERKMKPSKQTPTSPMEHFPSAGAHYSAVQKFLLSGEYFGFPSKSAEAFPTRTSNIVAYCKNNHPFLSIFAQHEFHPFTASSRYLHLYCITCWTLMLTAVFGRSLVEYTSICNGGCDTVTKVESMSCPTNNIAAGGCCINNTVDVHYPDWLESSLASIDVSEDAIGANNGLWISKTGYDVSCYVVEFNTYATTILIGLLSMPYDFFLTLVATGCGSQGCCLENTIKSTGRACLWCCAFLSTIYLAIAILFILEWDQGIDVAVNFFLAQGNAWAMWFATSTAWFALFYGASYRRFRKQYPGLNYIMVEGGHSNDNKGGNLKNLSQMRAENAGLVV
ncbi:hypothetical protein TL16_g12504 [Triparma laevis f. inornata]|uniref:Uncharacterized protein n=1 Tax=Triparma laevis f. inornata TaxID=1714386 RepID=A0A9W7BLR8_9STRA|nr:hypothetical protein TL16_g12504 [Triparma laevis f. inornata]